MPRITSLPGGEATTLADTDNLVVEPSGGQTKYAAFSALLDGVNTEMQKGCRVYSSSAQSLTAGVSAALTFNGEDFDYGGYHSTVSNTSRITIPTGEGGIYVVGGCVAFDQGDGYRALHIKDSGTTTIASAILAIASATATTSLHLSTICSLAAADYVELLAYHNSSTDPLLTLVDTNSQVHFWAYKLFGVAP